MTGTSRISETLQRVGNGWEPRRERGLKINRELQPEKPERLIKVSRNESVILKQVVP